MGADGVGTLIREAQRRHGLRPEGSGLQAIPADALVKSPFDPGLALLVLPELDELTEPAPGEGFAPERLPGRAARADSPAALLQALYPADHPVLSLRDGPDLTIAELNDERLRAGALLIPALEGPANVASPHGLPWLVARLRAPDGCPWDREQTHLSLRRYLLEESYEVYDALETGSTPGLAEELGDLLLQVILHAQYAAEEGVFDLTDVYRGVMTKIVRRHPHVFGDVEAASVDQVIRNWEAIKADERATRTGQAGAPEPHPEHSPPVEMPAAFAGLSRSLPALAYAQEMQERAASLGYDWPDREGVVAKIQEELGELQAAPDEAGRNEEFGDLLLVMVNLGRWLGLDSEAALRSASAKFAARFARVERLAAERGVGLRDLDATELDSLWQGAKAERTSA
jgi:tetrapyrrole methylase family protein/MazG family protein